MSPDFKQIKVNSETPTMEPPLKLKSSFMFKVFFKFGSVLKNSIFLSFPKTNKHSYIDNIIKMMTYVFEFDIQLYSADENEIFY